MHDIQRIAGRIKNRCWGSAFKDLVFAVGMTDDFDLPFIEQAKRSFKHLDAVLEEAGSDKSRIFVSHSAARRHREQGRVRQNVGSMDRRRSARLGATLVPWGRVRGQQSGRDPGGRCPLTTPTSGYDLATMV